MTSNNKTRRPEQAAIYIRCSTGDNDKFSLQAQEEVLTRLAVGKGWGYEIYNERVQSGRTIADRPEMTRLLRDAGLHKFSVCVVVEFERLSRAEDLQDWARIKRTFLENSIMIQTPQQCYDLSEAEDGFLSDLFGILSIREKNKIAERCRRGMDKAKREGAYLGGFAPMGYRNNRKTKSLEVNEEEARVIRLIFDLAETMSAYKVCQHLNERGIKTKTGAPWNERNVRRVINHLTYAGKRRLPDGQIVELRIKPLVSFEQFQRVQLGKKLRLTRAHDTNPRYLLTGILRCPYCGRSVCSWQDKRWRKSGEVRLIRYYTCSRKRSDLCRESGLIRMEDADRLVVDRVKAAISSPRILQVAHVNSGVGVEAASLSAEVERWRATLGEAEKHKANLVDALADGIIGPEDVKAKMRSLNDQISFAQGKMMELELKLKDLESRGATGVMELVKRFRELFDASDTLRQRELIKSLLERADLYRDRIILCFRFAVNPDGTSAIEVPLPPGRKQRGCLETESSSDKRCLRVEKARGFTS